MLNVEDAAAHFGVTEATILAWIRAGELQAINVARGAKGRRPRWRITRGAVTAFEAARTAVTPAPKTARRPKQTAGVIEFYRA